MSLHSRTLGAVIAVSASLFLTACGSQITPMTLPNAYNMQVPDPSKHGGKVIADAPIDTPAYSRSASEMNAYALGYADLSYEDLTKWLEENSPFELPAEMKLRTSGAPESNQFPYGQHTYTTDIAYCFATDRDQNLVASDSVTVLPVHTTADTDYPVILDVTVTKNSFGCRDNEYFSLVEPMLQQQGRSGGTWGDLLDSALSLL